MMAQKLRDLVQSEQLSPEARMLNLIYLVGLAVDLPVVALALPLGFGWISFFTYFGIAVYLAAALHFTNRFKKHRMLVWLTVLVLCNVLFPLASFTLGDVTSSKSAFFVLSGVLIMGLLEGQNRVILIGVHFAVVGLCYWLDYYFQISIPQTGDMLYFDHLSSFVATTLSVGLIIVLNRRLMEREQRRVEQTNEQLEREKLTTASMLYSTPYISLLFDDQLQLIDCNQAALDFMKMDKPALLANFERYAGETFAPTRPDSRSSRAFRNWLRAAMSDGKVQAEMLVQSPDGRSQSMLIYLERIPFRDSYAITGHCIEITPLREALERAAQAERIQEDFLAHMSYTLCTPLHTIMGMAEIGLEAADPERKAYALTSAKEAAADLLGRMNGMLELHQLQEDALRLECKPFDFERLMARIIHTARFLTQKRHLKLHTQIDSRIPRLLIGDGQRLGQVITNLLSNAIKFTDEEGIIRLEAALLVQDGHSAALRITVQDTGIGIEKEELAFVFEPFWQTGRIAPRHDGAGLGLHIARRIVKRMGGDISLESVPGEGSTFTFTVCLPYVASDTPDAAPLTVPRLLVVDGDQATQNFFRAFATDNAAPLRSVYSPEAAAAERNDAVDCDLCFLGIYPHDITAVATVRRLRAQLARHAALYVMTPCELGERERAYRMAGADGFLCKPLCEQDVLDALHEYSASPPAAKRRHVDILRGKRMLLAEDAEFRRVIVTTLLEATQINIDVADNGLEAVEMFRDNPGVYDLILMDVHMPEMDGYAAARAIRATKPDGATVPIIAMMANVFQEEVEKCLQAGMSGHIGKRLNVDELISLMREIWGDE
jgi:signal transduction histidine kinase/DNA-binding response OmpR family regulator